jgi:hypothetical protein
LCWFVVPLLRGIDQQKEALASMYPGLVLYFDSPNFQDVWNALQKKNTNNKKKQDYGHDDIKNNKLEGFSSSLWDSAGERIHLKLTDIKQQTKQCTNIIVHGQI